MEQFSFDTYLSPLTWRYGSPEMRSIFSERHKHEVWRRIWLSLARAQAREGLISKRELADLVAHEKEIDIGRILEIEKETRHDVMAAIREFAEKAKVGGGKIHFGATSMDIVDNADSARTTEALRIITSRMAELLGSFAGRIEREADHVCMGYTHLQPAEPTTVGYRLSFYAQELLLGYDMLGYVSRILRTKGMKGAVGTQASYAATLGKNASKVLEFERQVMRDMGLVSATVSSQVATRLYDYLVLTCLSMIASAAAKFAADVRLLQSPGIGEWAEAFGKNQVGSSAMPFKKNPVTAEKICSLARLLSELPAVALGNARHSYLERTLDDSANKRLVVPEAFLILDEILTSTQKVITGLVLVDNRIAYNLKQYGPFAATEAILMEAVKNGANRQEFHEVIRSLSLAAWNDVTAGKPNPMIHLLAREGEVRRYVSPVRLRELSDPGDHIGTAPERARLTVKEIRKKLPHKQRTR